MSKEYNAGQHLKDHTIDQLWSEYRIYEAQFEALMNSEKKDALNNILAKAFPKPGKPRDKAFDHHLDVIHELWIRGIVARG